MLKDDLINIGQIRRIKPHIILHQENDLNAHLQHVHLKIHLVFDKFDDGQKYVSISKPTEHVVELRKFTAVEFQRYLARKRREQHHGYFVIFCFYFCKSLLIEGTEHEDDQVDLFFFKHFKRFLAATGLNKLRRITQVERNIFVKNLLVDAAVVFKDKSVVITGNEQYVIDAFAHQNIERRIIEYVVVAGEFGLIFLHVFAFKLNDAKIILCKCLPCILDGYHPKCLLTDDE